MHRWTLTALLTFSAGLAAWLAPRVGAPVPTGGDSPSGGVRPLALPGGAMVDGPLSLAVAVDSRALPVGETSRRYLVATVHASEQGGQRLPVDLTLVMDTSGSMAGTGKITEARRAVSAVVDALGPEDSFSLVRFSDTASVVLGLGHHGRSPLDQLVATLDPDGGTNLSGGLAAGFAEATRGRGAVRKLILMTDGQANQGVVAPQGLTRMAQHPGVTVSTVGLGLDFNESLLSAMADAGGGRYRYVGPGTDLTAAYAEELQDASALVATGARLEVDFATGVTPLRVFQWSADLSSTQAGVSIGDLAAGQSRTVVIEVDVTPGGDAEPELARFRLTGTALPEHTAFREEARAAGVEVAAGTDLSPWLDREAMAVSTRAVAGWSAMEANAAYQQGDAERGRGLLREAAGWMSRQQQDYGLPIADVEVSQLRQLGYLDDAEAQKGSWSAGRALGRAE